ncbi:MAG: flagellar basal body-associated FliL family protein [Hyphomicrobiaceae bacterium]|nr:flagellar basal body-associated FliL family protein [Hyphomicrobiaceae bacterium]
MADEPEEPETEENDAPEAESEGGETEGGEEKQDAKKSKLRLSPKKIAILAVPLLLLLGVGVYFAYGYFMPAGSAVAEAGPQKPKVYYNLPEMVVNLSSREKRAQYLKLKVSLEAPDQKVLDALNPIMPRVMDMFQLYLRELRSSDLEGSAGIYRLKEELLRRVNLEIHPHRVSRVLFNEIIVQ